MVLTRVPGLRTVEIVRRVRRTNPDGTWARDDRGNAVFDEKHISINGCSVQPGGSSEQTDDGRDSSTAVATIFAPPSWPGGVIDGVVIDGERWSIDGDPQRWVHPRLGHVVVQVRKVSG